MNQILALLLILSHGGHWIGGHEETISLSWPATSGMPASILQWECKLGPVALANGKLDMPDAEHSALLKMVPPVVRVRTQLRFVYSLRSKADNAELAAGESTIHLYPDLLGDDLSRQFSNRRVVLLDSGDALSRVLDRLKVPFAKAGDISHAALERADILIIAPDQLDQSALDEATLKSMALSGANIYVLHQGEASHIAGYRCGDRKAGKSLRWQTDHPLFAGLDSDTLGNWVGDASLRALQISADEAALEITYWEGETKSSDVPSPVDALLITKTVGAGRLVLCQIPADDWQEDPRSQMLLRNMLDYALTCPQPTPPPRVAVKVTVSKPLPKRNILRFYGETP